jgi:hypothetical protein
MSTEGMDRFLQATKAGAFVRALELANKSDRRDRLDMGSRNTKTAVRTGQGRRLAVRRLLLNPVWGYGLVLLAIARYLELF